MVGAAQIVADVRSKGGQHRPDAQEAQKHGRDQSPEPRAESPELHLLLVAAALHIDGEPTQNVVPIRPMMAAAG